VGLTAFSIGLAVQWHSADHASEGRRIRYRDHQALKDTLARHQVRLVLATYWNSYVLGVYSHGSLHAFPVAIAADGVGAQSAFSYLGIDLDVPNGRSAIALADAEVPSRGVWEGVEKSFGPPRLKTRSGPFGVWIYDNPQLHWALGAGPRIDGAVPPSRLRLDVERKLLGRVCNEPDGCAVRLWVRNGGTEIISSRGERPLRMGVQSLDRAGRVVDDLVRVNFARTLAPGQAAEVDLPLPWIRDPEVADLRLCLIQERVGWLCNRTRPFEEADPPRPR
jgi:hypothetical protein